jgi:hypothetical protein
MEVKMRLLFISLAFFLVLSWPVGAVEDVRSPGEGDELRQTEYTCNDGTNEGWLYLDTTGEGLANPFTPAVYPSKIEAVMIGLINYNDSNYGIQFPSCEINVWADDGGQPGQSLYSANVTLEAPGGAEEYWWYEVDISAANVVIESGAFWVGFIDDGTLSIENPYDDVDMCGTYYYNPGSGSWIALADLGFPYGMYLAAMVGEGVPVELASFDAAPSENGVLLTWRTVSETNCYGFYLTRATSQLGSYSLLDDSLVPGHGTTTSPHDYSFLDESATDGSWFYKLIQLDADGSETAYGPARVTFSPADAGSWGKIKTEFK